MSVKPSITGIRTKLPAANCARGVPLIIDPSITGAHYIIISMSFVDNDSYAYGERVANEAALGVLEKVSNNVQRASDFWEKHVNG